MIGWWLPLLWALAGQHPASVAVARDADCAERDAQQIVLAAHLAAAPDLPPDLLLAIGYIESRFDEDATSRMVAGARRTGSWPSREPAGAGPWFCGQLQTRAVQWADCLRLRDTTLAYLAGAAEVRAWLRRTRGNMTLALRGYACGNAGLRHRCRGYAERVMRRARHYQGGPTT